MSDANPPSNDEITPIKHYKEFIESGFYSWFNLTETKREKILFGQQRVWFKPGAHQEHIDIKLTMNANEHIWNAALILKRPWMKMGNGHNPMAVDITQSFIATMAMPDEADEMKPIVAAMWAALRTNPGMLMITRGDDAPPAPLSPALTEFIDVYLGKRGNANLNLSRSALFASNEVPSSSVSQPAEQDYVLIASLPNDPMRHAHGTPSARTKSDPAAIPPRPTGSLIERIKRAEALKGSVTTPPAPTRPVVPPTSTPISVDPADEPKDFHFVSIGLPGFIETTIRWDATSKRLVYTKRGERLDSSRIDDEKKIFQPSSQEWRGLWQLLNALRAWGWQDHYRKFVFDGHHWRLSVAHGSEFLVTYGENDYPPGWDLLHKYINQMVQGALFERHDFFGDIEDLLRDAELAARVHDGPEAALPTLIDSLRMQPNTAAKALGDLKLEALPAVPALLNAIDLRDRYLMSSPILKALGEIASASEHAPTRHIRELGLTIAPILLNVLVERKHVTKVRYELLRIVTHLGLSEEEVMPALIASVQDGEHDGERLCSSVYYALRDMDSRPPEMLPVLLTALSERVYEKYGYAEELVELIKLFGGEATAQAVDILIPALSNSSHDIRYVAAGGLAEAGELAAPAVPALIAALQDKADTKRWRYAAALGKIGVAAEPAMPALIEPIADTTLHSAATHAAEAVGRIAKRPEIAIPALLKALTAKSRSTSENARSALIRYGADVLPVLPALIDIVQNSASDLRKEAIQVIGSLGASASASLPALIEVLADDHDRWTRCEAADAIGKMGAATAQAIPALQEACHDPDIFVRQHAAKALGKFDYATSLATLSAVVEQSVERTACANAILTLGEWGSDAAPAIPALLNALKANDSHIRHLAVNALGNIGAAAKAVLPTLATLDDPDDNIIVASAIAVRKIDPLLTPQALATLTRMLHHQQSTTRSYAIHTLEDMGAAAAPALDELTALTQDEYAWVGKMAVKAIKTIREAVLPEPPAVT